MVIEVCRKLRCRSALIDGEIIVQDDKGVSDFAALSFSARPLSHLVL
jgi:ATP-dependent DNA ligase